MRVALINPNWTFDDGIYLGCREPHLPLEFGYAQALLGRDGHEVTIIDGHLEDLDHGEIQERVERFLPDMTVVTTAPGYMFWHCAPPDLHVPQELLKALEVVGGLRVVVGPHGSATPAATLRKLGVEGVIMGECEEVLPRLAGTPRNRWHQVRSICYWDRGKPRVQGPAHRSNMAALPALGWPRSMIASHRHWHGHEPAIGTGPAAEMEATRGRPYHQRFDAGFEQEGPRRRPHAVLLRELDGLLMQGVEYVYFLDEEFQPNQALLQALAKRPLRFGIQTRIELWGFDMLDLLGEAGCVSLEARIERLDDGHAKRRSPYRMTADELATRLIYAKQRIGSVSAGLVAEPGRDTDAWCAHLNELGVKTRLPDPAFPYPGSPQYRRLWGTPDEQAWERALDYYLEKVQVHAGATAAPPAPPA